MKRCKSVQQLDYAIHGDVIYPYVFQTSTDFMDLMDAVESGVLMGKSKKRKREA